MWILGHTVLAYLIVKTLFSRPDTRFDGRIIFFIFIFANITDSLHIGPLRDVIHNPGGTFLYSMAWIWLFKRVHLIEQKHILILLAATGAHIIGDLLFSYYHPFLPFNDLGTTLYAWNSREDLIVESILAILFFIVMKRTGDLARLDAFIRVEMKKYPTWFDIRRLTKPTMFPSDLIILFFLFVVGQFVLNLIVNFDWLIHGVWFSWTFTILFLVFIMILLPFSIDSR